MKFQLKSTSSFILSTIFKSLGLAAIVLVVINTATFLMGIVTQSLYEPTATVFQQSLFSLDGRMLGMQIGEFEMVGFFVLVFAAVLTREIKAREVQKSYRSADSQTSGVVNYADNHK